ncbi:MAG TPA: hypothetical protein VK913_03035 [Erythrobacter sp.]|nr:hypothetical protein [Erythrobacter sp.]
MMPGSGSNALHVFAGKTSAERQLEFALALGCNSVICLSSSLTAPQIALQHAAERAGARFHCTGDTHAVARMAGSAEQLVVMAPGLIPLAMEAHEALKQGDRILTLPAEAGIAAGFERIDLHHAWGGALSMSGRLAGALTSLPQDCDPVSALLRIAAQAKLPHAELSEKLLTTGQWVLPGHQDELAEAETAWLGSRVARNRDTSLTGRLAALVLHALPVEKLGRRRLAGALFWAAPAMAAGAVVIAAGLAMPGIGILLLAPAALSLSLGTLLLALQEDDWLPRRRKGRAGEFVIAFFDIALILMAYVAIAGTWYERLFPPLVLAGLLRLALHNLPPRIAPIVTDRAMIALIVGIAAVMDRPALATMAISIAFLAAMMVAVIPKGAANMELTKDV